MPEGALEVVRFAEGLPRDCSQEFVVNRLPERVLSFEEFSQQNVELSAVYRIRTKPGAGPEPRTGAGAGAPWYMHLSFVTVRLGEERRLSRIQVVRRDPRSGVTDEYYTRDFR